MVSEPFNLGPEHSKKMLIQGRTGRQSQQSELVWELCLRT
jgi:hypothetical protein